MEQQQQHHARRLTPMEVTLEPWSHNNGDYINEIVIDDLDAMDAFDIVPISYNHTPLSRIMFATNYINPRVVMQTMFGTNHIQPIMITQVVLPNYIQDGDHVDTKVQSVIVPQEIYGPTKKDEPITSKRSTRIKKTPNWMKDCVLF
ncbi:hypothetical protein QL285_050399 [Trifolium repens]|nr:hypothetical protein QL285_050399 [Trifolium repens]